MVVLTQSDAEEKSIVFIGPTGVGKSAVGRLLADQLGWELVELDELRSSWYPEFGLDTEAERDAWQRGGLPELVAMWKPYELRSVERVMSEHPFCCVIAFGGGQSVYMDEEMVSRAKSALSAASRVILLLPSEHEHESLAILHERLRTVPFITEQSDPDGFLHAFDPILKMQLQSESNRVLATELIITGHSSPEELARHLITTMGID